jgi:hypothetical protein
MRDVTARAKDPKFPSLECPTPSFCRSSFERMEQIVSINGTGLQAGKDCSWGTGKPFSRLPCPARCSLLSQTAGHAGAPFIPSATAVILFSPFQFLFSDLHFVWAGPVRERRLPLVIWPRGSRLRVRLFSQLRLKPACLLDCLQTLLGSRLVCIAV